MILWQLIENFSDYVDPSSDIEEFFNLIWNVNTAQGYGLDVWGRIVGVNRVLRIPSGKYFGFEQEGHFGVGSFGQAVFYTTSDSIAKNYILTDDEFRVLIWAKALANICDGSIAGINQVLLKIFPGRGEAYVVDGEDMTMVYTFGFSLSVIEEAIVRQSGILPRPTGVKATYTFPA